MSYFKNLPTILYNFGDIQEEITDISVNIRLIQSVKDKINEIFNQYELNGIQFDYDQDITEAETSEINAANREVFGYYYSIQDNESLDIISYKVYGNSYYHWVIMLVNDIYDYIDDMPLNREQLINFCEKKYGIGQLDIIKQYKHKDSNLIVDPQFYNISDLIPISNFDFEDSINEKKRKIRIPPIQMVTQIVNEQRKLIK